MSERKVPFLSPQQKEKVYGANEPINPYDDHPHNHWWREQWYDVAWQNRERTFIERLEALNVIAFRVCVDHEGWQTFLIAKSVLADVIQEHGYEATAERLFQLCDYMQSNNFEDKYGGCGRDGVEGYILSIADVVAGHIADGGDWEEEEVRHD